MTNLAAARAAHAADFTNGVTRRVVVVHVTAFALLFHGVDHLCITERRKRDNVEPLGHTAGEQARTVRSWQQANLTAQLTDFGKTAAVGAKTIFQDTFSDVLVGGAGEGVFVITFYTFPF